MFLACSDNVFKSSHQQTRLEIASDVIHGEYVKTIGCYPRGKFFLRSVLSRNSEKSTNYTTSIMAATANDGIGIYVHFVKSVKIELAKNLVTNGKV